MKKLYNIIQSDSRHGELRVIRFEVSDERSFDNFTPMHLDDNVTNDVLESYITAFSTELQVLEEMCGTGTKVESEKLVSVTYVSTMRGERGTMIHKMHEIVEKAKEKNRENGITGLLIYEEESQRVRQTIEGPEENIRSLLACIKADDRHEIHVDPGETEELVEIKSRNYMGWDMMIVVTTRHPRRRNRAMLNALAVGDKKGTDQVLDEQAQSNPWLNTHNPPPVDFICPPLEPSTDRD